LLVQMREASAGRPSPYFRSEIARVTAKLAALRGERDEATAAFEDAVDGFRGIGTQLHLAVALAEYGWWLDAEGHLEEALGRLAEARELFVYLQAAWWLERMDAARGNASAIG